MFKDPIEVSAAMMRMAGYMMECQMRIGLGMARAAWGEPTIPARKSGARGPVTRPNETTRRVIFTASGPKVVDVSPRRPAGQSKGQSQPAAPVADPSAPADRHLQI
ncbi:hypothetical protein E0K89_012575 [Aquicoccus sp. SCR17]|nr:hypothetical protein [Carideicomes alvinocaridis]